MVRWLGVAALGGLLPMAAGAAEPAWTAGCSGQGAERRCSVSAVHGYPNSRGGRSTLTVTLIRDAACATLHVTFDGPIALERPARLPPDGGPAQEFYTAGELAQLAHAVDGSIRPAHLQESRAPAEFARFLARLPTNDPEDEMVARFAALKEPRRLGLACAPMERLMPRLANARALRIEFSAEPGTRTRVYHWLSLTERSVEMPLEGLRAALDRVSTER